MAKLWYLGQYQAEYTVQKAKNTLTGHARYHLEPLRFIENDIDSRAEGIKN